MIKGVKVERNEKESNGFKYLTTCVFCFSLNLFGNLYNKFGIYKTIY